MSFTDYNTSPIKGVGLFLAVGVGESYPLVTDNWRIKRDLVDKTHILTRDRSPSRYSWTALPVAPSFTEVMRQANGPAAANQYGNYFNGFMCYNRNFTTSGSVPTSNPSGTIWRIRAIGVTGANATTAATGVTGAFAIQDINSGGHGGYQACFRDIPVSEGRAAFGASHTQANSSFANATWIIERQN